MVRTISKQEVDEYISEIVKRVVPEISPEKIYLFGSFSGDDYDQDSDIDLCFVVENSRSIKDVKRKINEILSDRIMPLDIIVCFEEDMEKRRDVIGTIQYRVAQDGELIYERGD